MADPSQNRGEQKPPSSSVHKASSATRRGLMHNPGFSRNWTGEEQAILEEGLALYANNSNVMKYAMIAKNLGDSKTTRDVALRVWWMTTRKETGKRKKVENKSTRKSREKKVSDPVARSSQSAAQPSVSPHAEATTTTTKDNDDDISQKAIGGPAGELLEQNAQALSQISTNLADLQFQENLSCFHCFQIQENNKLFSQTRDNILKILKDLNDGPEVMKQMPPLPFKINETILNTILLETNHQMQ